MTTITRWMESWDYTDTTKQRVAFVGGTLPLVTAGAGRRGTNGLTGGAVDAFAAYGASGTVPVAYGGVSCRHIGPSGWGKVLGLGAYLNGGQEHLTVFSRDDGSLAIYGGSGTGLGAGTMFGLSDPGVIVQDAAQYIEAGIALDAADGWVEVRVGSQTVFRVTGIPTLTSGLTDSADVMWLYPLDNRRAYDDLYLRASGTFAGSVRIDAYFPDGDVPTPAWNRNQGTENYANVFERVPDELVTYNHTQTSGAQDLFTFEDLRARRAGVMAIDVLIRARRALPAGSATVQPVLYTDGLTTLLQPVALTSGFAYASEIVETYPLTSGAFTDTEFDTSVWGYRRPI
jgi:hypothetical protein